MTAVQCQIDIPQVQGLVDQELTVGRDFFLNCHGTWPKDWQQENVRFVLPAEAKYQIHLRQFEFRDPETADLKVVSYQAAPVSFENLQLTDGVQTIDLGKVEFAVKSVIEKPQDPQQKVEAYGPMGPAQIPLPMAYVMVAAACVCLVGTWAGMRVYRYSQRRRLLARLKQHDAALLPLPQFHQALRSLKRDNSVFFGTQAQPEHVPLAFDEIHRMLRLFLIRELHVPAFDWKDKLILAEIKKYHADIYEEFGPALQKLLREFEKADRNRQQLTGNDVLVLSEQTRKWVEKVDRQKGEKA